jgi:hypothetical protein
MMRFLSQQKRLLYRLHDAGAGAFEKAARAQTILWGQEVQKWQK